MSYLEERLRQQLPELAARMVESHAAGTGQPVTSIGPRRRRNRARRLIQLAAAVALLAAAASVVVDLFLSKTRRVAEELTNSCRLLGVVVVVV